MNVFSLLSSESSARLMITFGHCLWEGLVIAVVATLAARLLCPRNPNLRYAMYLAALVLLVACLPVTYLLVGKSSGLQSQPIFEGGRTQHAVRENPSAGFSTIVPQTAETRDTDLIQPIDGLRTSDALRPSGVTEIAWQNVAEWMSWAYLAGVVLMLARLGVSLLGAQRICRDTVPVESPAVLRILDELVQELGIRVAPTLAWSKQIVAPTVFGIIRPTILLPFSLATALSPDELSSILAHELAHIRRHDLWINLFQRFVEALLFFHPAVWFLSRRLSAEREYCCDDVALSRGLGSIRYAELLVRLAEVRCRVPSTVEQQVALAAAGDRPSQLRRRVARLFGLEEELTMTLTRRGAVTLAATFVMAATLFAVSVPAELPNNTDRQVADTTTVQLAEKADADKGQPDSNLSEFERALVGTWSRVSFLNETKLIFTAKRSYHYEYSLEARESRTGEIPQGDWKVENGTELVYLRRNNDGSTEESPHRERIVAVNEKELKLQPLSPNGDRNIYTWTRVAEAEKQPARPAATSPKSGEVTISGRIVLADGSPATSKGWLYSTTRKGWFYSDTRTKPGSASSKTFATEGQYTDSFSITVPAGTVWLKYFPDDYAPVWSGPFEVEDGVMVGDVTFTLKKGFTSTVRLTGEDGQPVTRATLIANPEIGGDTNGPVIELSANEQGQVSLKNLAETRYAFHVDAPGYEPLRTAPLKIEPDKTITLTMQRSEPTTGVVRNADGSAAKDAKLLWYYESYPAAPAIGARTYHHSGRVAATTDESGRFTLDQLARSAQNLFVVEAADGARLVVQDLRAGQPEVQLQVPQRRDLRVRVVGNLELLQKKSGKPFLAVRQDIEIPGGVRYGDVVAGDVFVTPTKAGGSASFQGLIPGRVTVMAGDHQQTFDVAESGVTDVVVQLGAPELPSAAQKESASAPTPETAESKPVPLGKVIELTVNDDNPKDGNFCVDFETGRLFSAPKELRVGRTDPPAHFEKWIIPNGIDAIGETKNSVRGLFGLDMVAIPIDGPADKLPEISANRLSSQFGNAVPGRPVPVSGKGELPATYLFQTREGSRGRAADHRIRGSAAGSHNTV